MFSALLLGLQSLPEFLFCFPIVFKAISIPTDEKCFRFQLGRMDVLDFRLWNLSNPATLQDETLLLLYFPLMLSSSYNWASFKVEQIYIFTAGCFTLEWTKHTLVLFWWAANEVNVRHMLTATVSFWAPKLNIIHSRHLVCLLFN